MKVLKWVLIVFGSLVLVLIAVIIGWLSTVEGVKLSAADLDVGGSYPAEERQALFAACRFSSFYQFPGEASCTCFADNAGRKLSRFDRLVSLAEFEGDGERFVVLALALYKHVAREKIDEMEPYAKSRHSLFESCRFKTQ